MIKAVLFDMGGVLHVSSYPRGRDVWFARRVLDRFAEYGMPLNVSPEEFAVKLAANAELYKKETEETMRELPTEEIWGDYYLRGFDVDREKLGYFSEELSFLYDYERPLVMRRPHLKETLEELKTDGYRLGLISNIISLSIAPHFLNEYGIADYMECVVLSSVCGWRKPSAEIFRVAERELKLKPEELAYVGDTISRDVRGVRNAGWRLMIQIVNPNTAFRDKGLEAITPDYRILDLAEVPAIIRAENNKEAVS